MFLQNNRIYTSGATGTNAAVIRGALRAEKPDLLTVVLPQSLSKQPPESQELLSQVQPYKMYALSKLSHGICIVSVILLQSCNPAKQVYQHIGPCRCSMS